MTAIGILWLVSVHVCVGQFEEAVGALPDPSWPVAQQLDHAVTTIKRNVKLILDTKAEMEHYKQVGILRQTSAFVTVGGQLNMVQVKDMT